MPWNDNNGSGGGGGGPWGSAPGGGGRGSGGGGPQPPDLEDLLRRGQDRFKTVFPGGNMSGSSIFIGLLILIFFWAVSGIYTVQPGQRGVVRTFGEYSRITQPGLNYHLPYPIETVDIPSVESIQPLNIGFSAGNRDIVQESLMLTSDENIVNIHFTVFWRISPEGDGPGDFLFNVQNPEPTIKAVAESAMRQVIGNNELQPIITQGRQLVQDETKEIIQATLDAYGAGVTITEVQLLKADPPDQVIEAFRDVDAARQDQDRVVNEATAYANRIVPEARGEAERINQEAQAYRAQTVVEANGEAVRFNSILKEYKEAPDVTRERIFLETMERVFRDKNKVVIDSSSGSGVVPYLPLPELQKRQGTGESQ